MLAVKWLNNGCLLKAALEVSSWSAATREKFSPNKAYF